MIWIWLAVMILALVCEACTTALVSVWFVPPAIICMVLAFWDVQVWIQAVVFFVVSIASIVVFHSIFKRKLANSKKKATNTDILIGEKAVVIEYIDNLRSLGCVKINGQLWSALAESENEEIASGEVVEIVAVKGVKLVCRKIKK